MLGSQQFNSILEHKHSISNKLFSKNFFLFLFFINFKNAKKSLDNYTDICVFIKPKKVKKFTLLRAPYRYKVGRIHLMYSRYTFVVSFKVNLSNTPSFNNIDDLKQYNSLIENSFNHLTTKLNTLYRYNYTYNCTYKNIFLISAYF